MTIAKRSSQARCGVRVAALTAASDISKSHRPSRALGRWTQRCTPVALAKAAVSPLTFVTVAANSANATAVGPVISDLALIAVAVGEGVNPSAIEFAVTEVTLIAVAVGEGENASTMAHAILKVAFITVAIGEGVDAAPTAFAVSKFPFVATPVSESHEASAGNFSISKLAFVASSVRERRNASAIDFPISKFAVVALAFSISEDTAAIALVVSPVALIAVAIVVSVGAVTAPPPIKIFPVVLSNLGRSIVLPMPLDDAATTRATIQTTYSTPGHCRSRSRIGVPDPAPVMDIYRPAGMTRRGEFIGTWRVGPSLGGHNFGRKQRDEKGKDGS